MRYLILLAIASVSFVACKNAGQNTSQAKAEKVKEQTVSVKEIIIENTDPVKPNFRIVDMTTEGDVLTVVFQYSGGCEEHNFDAYFSGGWRKTLPPTAGITFKHLDPKQDACRSVVKDTVQFNMKPLRYSGSDEVVIQWTSHPERQLTYNYGNNQLDVPD